MKNYLIEKGISPKDIIVENQSTNTFQNMRFSKHKIDENTKDDLIKQLVNALLQYILQLVK